MAGAAPLSDWTVVARNLPEHAWNSIHTDEGARAAGFPAALVAGVTTYAYLCHPVAAAWGLDWVAHGGAELRLLSPVFDGDIVDCTVIDGAAVGEAAVEARVDGDVRATVRAMTTAPDLEFEPGGEELPVLELPLAGKYGADYAERAGDDLDLFTRLGIVHPAVWVALANSTAQRSLVDGPWIHVRSVIAHHAAAPVGALARVESRVVRRSERRSGERVVSAVTITADGVPVATLEHEAIVRLT
jgi:hypothetical protein